MRWIVYFEDTSDMLRVRQEREPLHLHYLQQHEDEILLAGGCRNAPGEDFVGGLWVLEVPTRQRAVELIEADPYFVPAFRRYTLRTWGKPFADKKVVL